MKTFKTLLFAALATIGFSYGYADEVEHIPENLPEKYVKVDYISSGSKQYIDTGIGTQDKLRVKFDFQWNAISKTSGQYMMGSYTSSSVKQYVLNNSNADVWRAGANADALHAYSFSKALANKRYSVESFFNGKTHTLTIDGVSESYTGASAAKTDSSAHLYLFNYVKPTSSSGGYPGDAKLYSCQMYTGATDANLGNLVRDYMPVYNLDTKKYGLYEWVTGDFKPSAYSTGFTGPAVVLNQLTVADTLGENTGTVSPDYGTSTPTAGAEITFENTQEIVGDDNVRSRCIGWKLYNVNGKLIDEGTELTKTITFNWPETAKFEWQWVKECRVSAEAVNGSVDGTGWHAVGTEVTLTATGSGDYQFKSWSGDGVTEDMMFMNPLVFTMPDHAMAVTAAFAEPELATIVVRSNTVTEYGKGSLDPDYGEHKIKAVLGSAITFTCPETVELEAGCRVRCVGYKVFSLEDALLDEGVPTVEDGVATANVVYNQDFKLEWQWIDEYYVAAMCDEDMGSVAGEGWYAAASEVSLQATPKDDKILFDGWTGDVPEGCETANPLVFAMPARAVQFTAAFAQTYPVAVTTLHGYTVSVLGGTSSFPAYFREGALVTLQYGPNATAKYTWDGLPEDAVINEATRTVSFTMPADGLNLTLDGEDVVNPDAGWVKTIVEDGIGYTVAAFTKTGVEHEFKVPAWVESMEYLVVGGGGSGGRYARCGGGGAGGLVTNVMAVVSGTNYTIKVGAGGAALSASTTATSGNQGGDSTIELNDTPVVIAYGGGGGGTGSTNGKSGGSGGGAGGYSAKKDLHYSGGAATQADSIYGGLGKAGGNVVGTTSSVTRGGGGGGGAGGNGANATGSSGAKGGDGVESMITGEAKWYAAGGGGGGESKGGAGGSGIGGKGADGKNGSPGVDGTGSGGGGTGNTGSYASGKGGDGIVILRYRNQVTLTVTGTPTEVEAVTPACGKNEHLSGEVVTCTADKYFQSADHVREYCLGWELLDAAGNVVRSSETTEDPDESALVAKVALAESMTLNWLWETRYELSVVSANAEQGAVTGSGYYAPGALVEIAATPTEGYRFAEWSNVPEELKYSTPIQITAGESPLTITATFEDVFEGGVTVEAEGGQHGEPDPAYGDHEYNKGDVVTFSAGEIKIIPDPEEGSRMALVGWKLYDNADLTTPIRTSLDQDEQYDTMTLTFGETSETLKWVWEKQYPATLTAEHGAITGPEWTSAGSSATYTAAANDGYAFDKWLLNGEEATAEEDGSLVVADVESAYTVEATFVEIPWGIDVVELVAQDGAAVPKTTHNRVFVDGPYSFPCPAEYVTLTENDTRLKCIGYTVDGGELVEDLTANVTFSRTQDPMPMTIEWQYATEYYLAVTADDKGTVDVVSGWQAENAELTLTATPNDGFAFSNWKVDGKVALENPLEVTMTAATTVEAVFYDPATTERIWTGAKNANWSEAANWFPAVLPTEETDIVISEDASVKLNDATTFKVRNLTIDGGTATITKTGLDTTFTIGGNLKLVNGGTLTCSSFASSTAPLAINLIVNGEEGISIDGASEIDAIGMARITGSGSTNYGSPYGGRGGYKSGTSVNSKSCYGSIRQPHDYGTSGPWQGYAGGVIHLVAANGPIQIAKGGKISADSVQSSSGGGEGSGGSVWLEAKAVTGEGLVSAKSSIRKTTDSAEGGAGRIAVYQTEATTSDNLPKLDASAVHARGGAGTVYIENANDKGRGWLIVEGCGSAPTPDMVACCIEGKVTGYDTPFKKITVKNCANFVVAEGITLKTDELDIKGNGTGKIFANYKDVVTEGYGTIKITQGLAIMFY